MPPRVALAVVLTVAACGADGRPATPGKLYVCAVASRSVEVIDAETLVTVATIPAGDGHAPHNVTVTPAGDAVLVTNPMTSGEGDDELLVIDPRVDAVVARVALPAAAFVAHVVVSPDGATAYVSGFGSDLIHTVELATRTRGPDIAFPAQRRPHGLRLSADGRHLYVAGLAGVVSEIDTAAGVVAREFPLPGPAVQVAVTDAAVFASLRSPPAVARIDRGSGEVRLLRLPDGAIEPAQVLATPSGRVLVVDQGDVNRHGELLWALDPDDGQVLATAVVGLGAHGLALSADGRTAWVTGVFDDSVTAVDLVSGEVVGRRYGAREPYGIELWSSGASPR